MLCQYSPRSNLIPTSLEPEAPGEGSGSAPLPAYLASGDTPNYDVRTAGDLPPPLSTGHPSGERLPVIMSPPQAALASRPELSHCRSGSFFCTIWASTSPGLSSACVPWVRCPHHCDWHCAGAGWATTPMTLCDVGDLAPRGR